MSTPEISDTLGGHEAKDCQHLISRMWVASGPSQGPLQRPSSSATPVTNAGVLHLRNGTSWGERHAKHPPPISSVPPKYTKAFPSDSDRVEPLVPTPLFSLLYSDDSFVVLAYFSVYNAQ